MFEPEYEVWWWLAVVIGMIALGAVVDERNFKMAKENNKEIDHTHTAEIVCPWCGHKFLDCWEFEDDGDMECYECDRPLTYSRSITVTYSTRKVEPEETT